MSGPDPAYHSSYTGQPPRGPTVQGLRFDSRMIRSRRGSAISSMSHTQSTHPCDSVSDIHLPTHVGDQEYGGVPLTTSTIDAFSEYGNAWERSSQRLSSRQSWTTEPLWNDNIIRPERDARIPTQADFNENYRQRPALYERSSGYSLNNGTARFFEPNTVTMPHVMALGERQENMPFISPHASHFATAVSAFPSADVASTRHQGTVMPQSAHHFQPTSDIHHDGSAWVDYDVSDFLEHWDIQYHMGEAGLVHTNKELRLQWQSPGRKQGFATNRDMQGLDWGALQTSRDKARLARKMLYPLRYSWTSALRYDEGSTHRQQHMYAFKNFYRNHRAKHSHGQLRNVLAARSRNDVFYASKSKVMHTSLSCPACTNVVVDLSGASANPNQAEDTEITTIAVSPLTDFNGYYSDAVLVTGGLMGEYSLLNLNSVLGSSPTEGFVTTAKEREVTHVHTTSHRRSGALGAVFCSNDSNVRLLDINTNTWTAEFKYDHQINCAATSADGRLRVVVGDTCETHITDAEKGDVLFRTQQHTGFGFACAWAPDGWHVATGSEDGKVVVYDARRWDVPLAALACEMSCARSLHFTTSNRGGPALVVAESDDIVSVYDANDWHNKQTMDFFGSVVGAASVNDGQELIVANGDKTVGGLMVFERKDHIHDKVNVGGFKCVEKQYSRGNQFAQIEDPPYNLPQRAGRGFDELML